jgi:hypothetical protein
MILFDRSHVFGDGTVPSWVQESERSEVEVKPLPEALAKVHQVSLH